MNSSNSLQTLYTYDPFDNVTTTGTASSYPYLFGGMELDSSGLYHTLTRTYSPTAWPVSSSPSVSRAWTGGRSAHQSG